MLADTYYDLEDSVSRHCWQVVRRTFAAQPDNLERIAEAMMARGSIQSLVEAARKTRVRSVDVWLTTMALIEAEKVADAMPTDGRPETLTNLDLVATLRWLAGADVE